MSSILRAMPACTAASFAFLIQASAQSLQTIEGMFPHAAEFTIESPNACAYPTSYVSIWFLPNFASSCGSINSFVPQPQGLLGDVALDKVRDLTWATDGLTVAAYDEGNPQFTFALLPGMLLPAPLTGLGFDSENDRLWLTDGARAIAITPPTMTCPLGVTVAVPSFALPTQGTVTDIDWDSFTDTLWICDSLGRVTNVTICGAVGQGGMFSPTQCSMTPPLSGIAFDSATDTLFITDGVIIEHVTKSGLPAPSTFYAPSTPCNTTPPPGPPVPLSGLAYAPRPLRYGTACATAGTPPFIGFEGQFSTSPNPGFAVTLNGSLPFTPAVLLLALNAPCPGISWGACEVLAIPPFLVINAVTDAGGAANVALPIPSFSLAGGVIGATIYAQWLVLPMVGRQASEGLGFTLSNL